MTYFSQFKWAIPHAFADALGQCQFGEGDVLYPTRSGYQESQSNVSMCLQVLYPPRDMTVPKEDIAVVFKKNWNSEVRLQKYTIKSGEFKKEGELITSTQGRLYSALWKDDLGILEVESENPFMPTMDARKSTTLIELVPEIKDEDGNVVQKRKVDTETRIQRIGGTALKKSKESPVFVMPYDRANRISTAKFFKINEALESDISGMPILLTPKQANVLDWNLFLPTIQIALFVTPSLDVKTVEEKVKKVTYAPQKNSKTNEQRYNLRSHGAVFG